MLAFITFPVHKRAGALRNSFDIKVVCRDEGIGKPGGGNGGFCGLHAMAGERERSELVSAVRDHEMRKEGEATRVAG